MAWFPQQALNDGVRKREVFGWAMYDFANSGYIAVVLQSVFNAYFVSVVCGGAPWATLALTLTVAAASFIVMVSLPAVGAYADLRAAKKRLLAYATIGCVTGTAALALAGPGDLWIAVAALVVSNVAYAYGESLNGAFLPELAKPESLGRVSGWGWSFGYLGGMLSLGISLAYVIAARGRGEPASSFVPVTMLITAAVYGVASLVTFALLKERAVPATIAPADSRFIASLRRLATTARQARRYRDLCWFLACSCSYQAGISVVVMLSAVYAQQVLGFTQSDTMLLVFLVNIAAAVGAFFFGYWQDRIGHKPALAVTLVGCIAMALLGVLATGPGLFWVAAVLAGLCLGTSQSAGRALVGLFSPSNRRAEFFGLWTFANRLSAIVGPMTYGAITYLSGGNHRAALLATSLFFIAGLFLLRPVNVARGEHEAMATPNAG
jgi:UMF1 family MFS transporter